MYPEYYGLRRNIPTCVGKTPRKAAPSRFRSEHPHVRGENTAGMYSNVTKSGTSPRAWGKREESSVPCVITRNIPTCVGKTCPLLLLHVITTEHPHVRGENFSGPVSALPLFGTSPRAWGKLRLKRKLSECRRNIPTCVGKTILRHITDLTKPEHPHVRGENCKSSGGWGSTPGTSPRAWGKHPVPADVGAYDRNIPTCVGKTRQYRALLRLCSEHPHVRGENRANSSSTRSPRGTSPRAWGKR